jgi:hypothetical protein
MTPRRKKWLRTIGLVAAILVVVISLVKLTFLNASDAYQEDAARLRKELKKLNLFNSREGRYQTTLDDCAAQTLGLDVLEVREQLRKRIGQMVEVAGLTQKSALARADGKRKTGVYGEIGWRCEVQGPLDGVVHMLYLLENDPCLHRIEGVSIQPGKQGRLVELSFRYITLVLEPRKKEKIITADPENPPAIMSLSKSESQKIFKGITERNIFRPYIPKVKVVARPPTSTNSTPAVKPPIPPVNYTHFKLVDLSSFGALPSVGVLDTRDKRVTYYRVGETLAGGCLVAVDYRPRPCKDDPMRLSPSRIVVEVGQDHFAIELGCTLDQKNLLVEADLPAKLYKKPKAKPAAAKIPAAAKTPSAPLSRTE